jgi:formylglycine-generating enzyme required for sulfatase activity
MKFLPNFFNRAVFLFLRAMKKQFLPIVLLFLHTGLFSQQRPTTSNETELTPEFVISLDSQLSNLTRAGQLEGYDKLVFGKGDFLRIEGKSRKSIVLSLDSQGRRSVKLFDLPTSDLVSPKIGLIYFGGVFSKAERTRDGSVEISVTYASLSPRAKPAYTLQAEAFARRTQELRHQNQSILNKEKEPVVLPPARPQTADAPAVVNQGSSKQAEEPTASTKTQRGSPKDTTEIEDEEDDLEPARSKPVLLRRERMPKEASSGDQTAAEAPHGNPKRTETPVTDGGIQSGDNQDVVIYRRKKNEAAGGATPAGGASPPVSSSSVKLPPSRQQNNEIDQMVHIPEGYVTLGSNEIADQEKPLHRVFVHAFYMDKYEVTNEEYKAFCDATGHKTPPSWQDKTFPEGLEKHPVVQVSWQDAMTYAKWAGKRLPTEAEWERAAKGPNSYRYTYGNAYDPRKANTNTGKTTAVGSYPPNEFGLFDMTGNVNEWTSSLLRPYPYKAADGREEPQAAGPRVLRGGSHSSGQENSRCLLRLGGSPDRGTPSDGFRCARDAD